MNDPQKIMACIDFSGHSQKTLTHALGLARARGASVVAFNAVHPRDVHPALIHESWFGLCRRAGQDAGAFIREREMRMRQWIDAHFPDHADQIEIRVAEGVPETAIVRCAKKMGATLVVLACKGRFRFSRLIFGSVSARVFQSSPVPVVRPGI